MLIERLLPTAQRRLVTIDDNASIAGAAKLLIERRSDLLVVHSSAKLLVGVITKTDIVRQIGQCQEDGRANTVSTIMARTVVLCHSNDVLRDVWENMKCRGLKNIPIVDHELRPIGVLNARDALEVLREEAEYEELLLGYYVMGVGYQ
ncbi:MAG: CBS domain-containing protein [Aestuariivirga sp.]